MKYDEILAAVAELRKAEQRYAEAQRALDEAMEEAERRNPDWPFGYDEESREVSAASSALERARAAAISAPVLAAAELAARALRHRERSRHMPVNFSANFEADALDLGLLPEKQE